jgi:hypothetical protein
MNENKRGHAFLPTNNPVTVEEVVRQNNRPASSPRRHQIDDPDGPLLSADTAAIEYARRIINDLREERRPEEPRPSIAVKNAAGEVIYRAIGSSFSFVSSHTALLSPTEPPHDAVPPSSHILRRPDGDFSPLLAAGRDCGTGRSQSWPWQVGGLRSTDVLIRWRSVVFRTVAATDGLL